MELTVRSHGQIEGEVDCPNLIKRQDYERASFGLLCQRLLAVASPDACLAVAVGYRLSARTSVQLREFSSDGTLFDVGIDN